MKVIKIRLSKQGFKISKFRVTQKEEQSILNELEKAFNKLKICIKTQKKELNEEIEENYQLVILEDYYSPEIIFSDNVINSEFIYEFNDTDRCFYVESAGSLSLEILGYSSSDLYGVKTKSVLPKKIEDKILPSNNYSIPVETVVKGTISVDKFLDTDNLIVSLYCANGMMLKDGVQVSSNGTYTTTVLNYLGIIIAKVNILGGNDFSYLNELTKEFNEVTTVFISIGKIIPGVELKLNLNSMTTIEAIYRNSKIRNTYLTKSIEEVSKSSNIDLPILIIDTNETKLNMNNHWVILNVLLELDKDKNSEISNSHSLINIETEISKDTLLIQNMFFNVIENYCNKNGISQIGYYDTVENVLDISLSEDETKAYLIDFKKGLIILDIRDSNNLKKLGSYNIERDARGISLSKDETKAFIANGSSGLLILDITNPINLKEIGSYNTNGYAFGVSLSQDETKAFIADGIGGLVVLDITNSIDIKELGSYNTTGYANEVALSADGTKAYVTDAGKGLLILDITNPTEIRVLASYNIEGVFSVSLSTDGTKAYIADLNNGLVVLDITDPTDLKVLGYYDTADSTVGISLSADEKKAYLAKNNSGLLILDITNPIVPTIETYSQIGIEEVTVNNIDIINSIVYNSNITDVNTLDKLQAIIRAVNKVIALLYNTHNNVYFLEKEDIVALGLNKDINTIEKLSLFNDVIINTVNSRVNIIEKLKNIANIVDKITKIVSGTSITFELNQIDFETIGVLGVTIYNLQNIILKIVNYGIQIKKLIEIQSIVSFYVIESYCDKKGINQIASYNVEGYIRSVTLSEDTKRAYIIDSTNKLIILDVRDTNNLIKLGVFNTRGYIRGVSLSVDGTKAYVADSIEGLVIFDITNPADLKVLSSHRTEGYAYSVSLSADGTKAYIADLNKGILVFDITNPVDLNIVGSYDAEGIIYKISLSADGTKAYIVDSCKGLLVLDVSDTNNLKELASYNIIGYAYEISLSENLTKLYIADGSNGLLILDIKDSNNLKLLSSYDAFGKIIGLSLSADGTKAFIVNDENGLVVLDITDPTNLKVLGYYDTVDSTVGISLSADGTKAYMAKSNSELLILDITNPIVPTIETYSQIGIEKVTVNNINIINSIVYDSNITDVNTVDKLQAITNKVIEDNRIDNTIVRDIISLGQKY